ncbi:MAG TPA: Bpu10I family restriction endonuclease [Bacteroidales bacterium]|jgi:hypothetical protein|nr:Bpu10I family restriction endonuclease [Bacteroidales bacterium]HOL75159.1 Bpu10I family restriction endonuclease [Bacteroidales bacterium]HPU46149.1 Bpu10I family restriction endonuclease [Bacteroidales bacterium]HXK90552.1 Bpu10I family restriction endonuclease [Bacteroidales bacterium]
MDDIYNWSIKNIDKIHVHGSNILTKIKNTKFSKNDKEDELNFILSQYKEWFEKNEQLIGYTNEIIEKRVKWLNDYKAVIKNIDYTAQSKFHSSVLEEFLYYLFRDLLKDIMNSGNVDNKKIQKISIGGIRAYSNLYFAPKDILNFMQTSNMKINVKDQDFSIYRKVILRADEEQKTINVPIVSIECKTYIDKTMLEGSIATADKIKNGNPYCLFLVVTETYDVSYEVDPAYSRIDQIYVLRKSKRRSNDNNSIDYHVIKDLFDFVKTHLLRDWSNIEKKLKQEGKIL